MKKLSLVLNAELEIPDDWELVEHSSGNFCTFLDVFVATVATAFAREYALSPVALGTAGTDLGERAALLLCDPATKKGAIR